MPARRRRSKSAIVRDKTSCNNDQSYQRNGLNVDWKNRNDNRIRTTIETGLCKLLDMNAGELEHTYELVEQVASDLVAATHAERERRQMVVIR